MGIVRDQFERDAYGVSRKDARAIGDGVAAVVAKVIGDAGERVPETLGARDADVLARGLRALSSRHMTDLLDLPSAAGGEARVRSAASVGWHGPGERRVTVDMGVTDASGRPVASLPLRVVVGKAGVRFVGEDWSEAGPGSPEASASEAARGGGGEGWAARIGRLARGGATAVSAGGLVGGLATVALQGHGPTVGQALALAGSWVMLKVWRSFGRSSRDDANAALLRVASAVDGPVPPTRVRVTREELGEALAPAGARGSDVGEALRGLASAVRQPVYDRTGAVTGEALGREGLEHVAGGFGAGRTRTVGIDAATAEAMPWGREMLDLLRVRSVEREREAAARAARAPAPASRGGRGFD